jgi:hypothetical protein
MFRVEPPPIIRSSNCTYSFWYLSNLAATCCDYGGDGTQSELLIMGGGSTPKHVERY